MVKLIKNEYSKIFLKKNTYIILAICLLAGLGISALVQFAYTHDYDYFYYSGETIQSALKECKNSDYIYDKLRYEAYSAYDYLGYTSFEEVPVWIDEAAQTAIYEHYAYIAASESSDTSNAELELGISLDGVDIDYEKKLYSDMIDAIKKADYKAYYKICIAHTEYLIKNNRAYDEEAYIFNKYMIDKDINPETDKNYVLDLKQYVYAKVKYDSLKAASQNGQNISPYELQTAEKNLRLWQYVIDNGLKNYMMEASASDDIDVFLSSGYSYSGYGNKFITAITSSTAVSMMAGLFLIIAAAGIISNEYSNGTIKFLLINPVKRAKIFWSKYLTCCSLLISTLAVFFAIYLLFCMILCGTDGMDGVYLSYSDGAVQSQPILLYSLGQYAMSAVSLLTSMTLAFTISAFLRSTALAIAISMGIELAGSAITAFLMNLGHDWGRYLLFSNTNLAGISNGTMLFPGQTVTFALVTIAIYMTVFLLTAYDGFTRKEI